VAVKSADRVLSVIEFLAARGPATFSEIVAELDLPNSSAHGLLQTLVRRKFVEFDRVSRNYRLGLQLWQVAQSYRTAADLARIAQPIMDRLVELTGETVQLARLDGIENIYLAIAESPHPMKLVSAVGKRLYAHATGLGKVLLASLEEDELRRRLSDVDLPHFTDNTIVEIEPLVRELADVRRRDYAMDREEYQVGCRCIAMPIRDESGNVIASMSISIPTPRYDSNVEKRAMVVLREAVESLSQQLGYVSSPSARSGQAEGSEPSIRARTSYRRAAKRTPRTAAPP